LTYKYIFDIITQLWKTKYSLPVQNVQAKRPKGGAEEWH
jgi:hypothetical protein